MDSLPPWRIVLFIGNHYAVVSFFTGPVCRFWVLRADASSFLLFFMLFKLYPRSLTTTFVVCNLCYEGSLVAASCNSLLPNDKRAIFPGRKKKTGRVTLRNCGYPASGSKLELRWKSTPLTWERTGSLTLTDWSEIWAWLAGLALACGTHVHDFII